LIEDIEIFPTLEEVEKGIEALSKNKWLQNFTVTNLNKDFEKISNEIKKHFGLIPSYKFIHQISDVSKIGSVFRAREYNTSFNINLLREYSYTPINLTKLNRCNFPQHPVLYSSENPITALFEVLNSNNSNKIFYISKWDIIPSSSEMIIESFLSGEINNENYFGHINKLLRERLNEPFENKLTTNQANGLKLYLQYLQDSFLNDNDYSISAFLAHRSLYAPHNIKTDMIFYPSTKIPFSINLAFHPNFVEKSMCLSRLYCVKIKDFDKKNGKIDIEYLNFGELERSHIKWIRATESDDNFKNDFNGLFIRTKI